MIPQATERAAVCLVDCTSFYVSAERLFAPSLAGRPTLVLSNNDGCIVSLDAACKSLGLKRGMPYFQCKPIIEQHHIAVLSSNYALYDDISRRIMRLLTSFATKRNGIPQLEVYSIDEAFLLLDVTPKEARARGLAIREAILQRVGIPVRVGIASTRHLAKIASELAKRDTSQQDVVSLFGAADAELDAILATIAVEDVWNIGPQSTKKLERMDIRTANDLRHADPFHVRQQLGINGQRVLFELRGVPCLPLEVEPKPKQNIMTALSFSRPITTKEELQEAVAHYAAKSAVKLRRQRSQTRTVSIFIHTNRFDKKQPQYANGTSFTLPIATNFTPDIIEVALDCLESIFRPGYQYRKAGVMLSLIGDERVVQPDLFGSYVEERERRKRRLMTMLDDINEQWTNALFFAAEGIKRDWQMKRRFLSRRFTTRWSEVVTVV